MKKFKVKVFLISMILLITGGITGVSLADGAATIDEFAELESSYESTSPKLNAAELSSTFTSEKEIEVYLETSRNDIDKIVISAWSGGAYSKFKTTKNATYDATREIYTATFNLDEIINTNTGAKENAEEALYSFDACVYGTNKTMSYYNLDNVQYTEKGFLASTKTSGDNVELTVKAVEDGEIAVLKDGEEVGENTVWQSVKKGENTISLMSLEDETNEDAMSSNVQTYSVVYKSPKIVSMPKRSIPVVTTNSLASSSTFQNDDIFSFEISQSDGLNTWMSYEDTPNIFESTIQGKHGETATAIIRINTPHAGILSFDYMSSSEKEFDTFKFEISGATLVSESGKATETTKTQTGENDWQNYTGRFAIPTNGVITLKLEYKKDKNVNRYEDMAAIKNLIFTPILPSNGNVIINNGAEYTSTATLDLRIYVEDATYMYITENSQKPSVNSTEWLPLLERTTYTLKDLKDGEKTIYVWFKNDSNAMSIEPAKGTIKLDNSAPTNEAPTVESTATEIKIKLNQKDENEFVLTEYGYRLVGTTDFTWSGNVNSGEHTMVGLTPMKEYEVKTRVSDGINDVVESEITKVKTKIPSDKIVIESSPSEKTLNNVIVTITWNNSEGYTQEYSLDGINYTKETNTVTTIEMPKNGIIYYQMNNGTYDTGVQKYIVGNIDREGPVVEVAEVVSPKSGKYGIGDEITLKITWNEEIYASELPKLNIKFNDDVNIPLTAEYKTTNEIVYKYTIRAEDNGPLQIISLEGGEVKDSLQNVATYTLPAQTGSEIYAENAAYIAATNTYYATIQNAVNAAGTEPVVIAVTANTELRNTVIIKEGQNITLDLNGKTVSIKNESSIVTAIENSGTLVIKDSTNTDSKITAYSEERSAYTIINNNTGRLTIENGKVEAVSNTKSIALKSYGIYNKEAGVITLGKDDGTVLKEIPEIKAKAKNGIGIKLVDANGRLYYCDGTIKGTSDSLQLASGAAAYIIPTGYMEKVEKQVEEYGLYTVSYLSNENTVELTVDGKSERYLTLIDALSRVPKDGRLSKIKMLANDTLMQVAKIYEGQNVELDLNGYTITRNEAIDGVIYAILNNGTLKITDTKTEAPGKIEAISQEDVKVYAVYNYKNGTITLDNVKLFAKNAGENEAFGFDYTGDTTSIVNLGNVIIYRDTLEKDKKYLNPIGVYLLEGQYLKQDTEIVEGITYKVNYGAETPNVSLTVNGVVTYYNSIQQAVNAAPTDGTIGEIKVLVDEELYTFLNIDSTKNISIDLNGKAIIAQNQQQAIQNNGVLTIKDTSTNEEGIIKVTNNNDAYGIKHGSKLLQIDSGTIMATSTNNITIGVQAVRTTNQQATIVINGGKLKAMANGTYILSGIAINNNGEIQSGKVNLPKGKHLTYIAEENYVTNYLADGEVVATLEQNGVVTNYASIQDAVAAVVADGTKAKITMYENESLGRQIDIAGGKNVELDLNGKEIYFGRTPVLIKNDGDIVINDSSNGEGKLVAVANARNGQVINNTGSGTVTINEGVISSRADSTFTTIYNTSTGSIIINGGKISGFLKTGEGRLIGNDGTGTIQINSGEITSNRNVLMLNWKNGNIEINGGNIKANGNIVENKASGTITINGGTLSTELSDAIRNENTGNITINNGNIKTTGAYSAICNGNLGNVYVYGGTIDAGKDGRGIDNSSKGKIIIGKDDGTVLSEPIIIGRYAVNQRTLGGEVYYYDGVLKGRDTNIVYPANTRFKSNETPTEKYYLIITTDDGYLANGQENEYRTIFYTNKANYELSYTENGKNIVKMYSSLRMAINDTPEDIKTKIVALRDTTENVYSDITSKQNIVLDLNGKSILLNDTNGGIRNSGTLQIIDSCTNGAGKVEVIAKEPNISAVNQYCTGGTLILGEDDGIVNQNKPVLISPLQNCINNANSTVKMYDGMLIAANPIFNNQSSKFILPDGYKFINRVKEGAIKEGYLIKDNGISIVPETAVWVNDNLNVKIVYSKGPFTYQYKINDGEWQNATTYEYGIARTLENIEVEENGTVYARSIDANSNVIYSEEYEVTNIDKVAPTIENITITTGNSTSQTITATGVKDNENGSGLKSYIVTMDTEAPLESADWIEITSDSITATVTKNGTWYIYVKDNCGNISNGSSVVAQNIDIDAPIVTNIEVVSPVTGGYSLGEVITIKANFSEEIVVNGTPKLKIKFGDGEEISLTSNNVTTNEIIYTYTIKVEDAGELKLVDYIGEGIKDTAGNDYASNEIELIGSKILAGTRAYIAETNKYYVKIKDAIEVCSKEATEYTTIKLINDDEYEGESVEIAEGQKIKIDLNGKAINISDISDGIIDNGDLIITDTTESKNGSITLTNVGNNKNAINKKGTGILQIDAGNITSTSTGSYIYGLYCNTAGTIEINGGKINAFSTGTYTYGLKIDNNKPKVIINGGEFKGKMAGISYANYMILNNSEEAVVGKITVPAGKILDYRVDGEYIVNYLADGEYVATLELNGETTNYLSLFNALAAVPINGTLGKITMYKSVDLYNTLGINAGQNIQLDLNGKEIYAQMFNNAISNKGTLKITDTSASKSGKVRLVSPGTSMNTIINEYAGTLEIENTTIELEGKSANAAVYTSSTGNLIIKNVTINTWVSYGGNAIYVYGAGGVEIYSGTFTSTASGQYGEYYGLNIRNKNAKIIIEGGEFKGKTGGIYIIDGMTTNNSGTYESGKVNIPQNKHIAHKTENEYMVNYLADGAKVVTLEVNGVVTDYLSIYDAVLAAPTDGTYAKITLYENEIISKKLEILAGQNIEIDLNGKEVTGRNYINSNGDLIINDTSEEQTGKVELDAQYVIYNQGIGTVELKSGLLKAYANTYSPRYGIHNNSTGTVKMSGGKINIETTHTSYCIYNASSGIVEFTGGKIVNNKGLTGGGIYNGIGTIIMNGGTMYPVMLGIENEKTGIVEINGGEIVSINNSGAVRNRSTGKVTINSGVLRTLQSIVINNDSNTSTYMLTINGGTFCGNSNSGIINIGRNGKINFNGGKLINASRATMFNPNINRVDIPENTYLKVSYTKSGDSYVYVSELDTAGDYELTTQDGTITYYNTLQEAFNAVPTNGTLSKIKLLTDCELPETVKIENSRKVQLDLNGHKIRYYSTVKEVIALRNTSGQVFEIVDTSGDGLIDVKAEGYNAYAIYNNSSSGKIRIISGKIQVTSIGGDAYGIYTSNGLSKEVGNEAIRVEGGSISVKSEIGTNSTVSGKAYGVYNRQYGAVCITGKSTMISATSALNESYGVYNADASAATVPVTIGEKDGIVSTTSPYIAGETAGIYITKTKSTSIYDGAITGKAGGAIKTSTTGNAAEIVSDTENNTFVYTKSNNDGTETVMLLKNIQSLNVKPSVILSNNLNTDYTLEISYMPADAAEVRLDVESSDVNIAVINEISEGVYSVRTKGEGSGEITITATDLSNKTLTQTVKLLVDTVAPTTTAPTATSTGSSVTITCNQEDENIDKNEIYYAISEDGVTWSSWSKRATINGLKTDTLYKVKTKASDLLGNTAESEISEIRTKLANNSKFTFNPDTMTKENVIVTITWNNPQKTPQYYKVGDGEWTLEANETTQVTVEENGTTIYTKLIYDGTEESDIKSATVDNIDRLAPTGTLAINEAYPRYDGYVTLKITGIDDASTVGDGLGTIAYMYITEENLSEAPAEDDEGWIKYEGDYDAYDYYIQKGEGEVSIYLWLMDKAHNTSNALVATTEFIPPVAVLFEDDNLVGEYQSIAEAYNAARTGNINPSTIIVCQDNTMTAQLTIAANKNIILDLNGKQINSKLNTTIINRGKLEINDGSVGGKLVAKPNNGWSYVIDNQNQLILLNGTIEIDTFDKNAIGIAIYNNNYSSKFEMTGGKIHAISNWNDIYGIYSYLSDSSIILKGGSIEVLSDGSNRAYGIYKNGISAIDVINTTIKATSTKKEGYGIYNNNATNTVTIGTNDGVIRDEQVSIYGSTYGLYRSTGKFNFYDGTIKGADGKSIYCDFANINTPAQYGIIKTTADGIETAKLSLDSSAPTIGSIEITNDLNVYKQTISAKNVEDFGFGIVAYRFSNSMTVPTKANTDWTYIEATNGPIDFSYEVTKNGEYYFWAMDMAGNISNTASVTAENIKIKVTGVTASNINAEVGAETQITVTLSPTGSEAANIIYKATDETIVHVNTETGVVTGLKEGNTEITVTAVNYDGTSVTGTLTVTVTDPNKEPVESTKTAPTLVAGYKKITATCNQTGENITNTYYAISSDGENYLAWQESNVFENLETGKVYYVKTKIVTADGETESVAAIIAVPTYTAKLEQDGTVTYYKDVQEAINNANVSSAKITMLENETRALEITVASGKNIVLDLDGHEINILGTSSSKLYGVTNKGTIKITDSKETGKLLVSSTNAEAVYGIYNDGGTIELGKIEIEVAKTNGAETSYAIYNNSGVATVGDNTTAVSTSKPKLTSTGYGLYNVSGTLNYYDGVIIAEKGKTTNGIINLVSGYKITTENLGTQDKSYLTELKVDLSTAMIMEWQVPANTEITLPISNGENVDIVVDYGDGNVEWVKGETFPKHTYQTAGTYQIKISGTLGDFGNYSESEITAGSNYYTFANYMKKLSKWGDLAASRYGFANCKNLNYVDNKPTRNTFKNVKNMSDMFYGCTSLKTLDLSNYSLTNVTNMQNMFNKMTNLASMQVSNQFVVVANSNGIFDNTNSLKAIIVSNKIPKAGAFTNVKDSLSSNVKFYVPTEEAYEKSWANDFGKERIEPILQLVGKTPIRANINETYQDAGYLVAGFEMEKAELYNCYGYTVSMLNTVDTSKEQTQTLTYRISRTYQSGAETIQEDLMDATREIKVVDLDKYMITEWNVSGDAGLEITLPVKGTGLNIIVDWGDGTEETITQEYPTHTYARAGVYEIAVVGNCPEWGYMIDRIVTDPNNENYQAYLKCKTSLEYIIGLKQWGSINATRYSFSNCKNLAYVSGGATADTFTNVTNMMYLFNNCTRLKTIDLSNFNTSNVKNMWGMFMNCTSVENLDVSTFDTSNVETMLGMFANCQKLKSLNLNNFNTSKVTGMYNMFVGCKELKELDLSNFDTSKVTTMIWMFNGCEKLQKIDMSSFDTSNVTTMRGMFDGCKSLQNIDLSNFNTSKVTNMGSMFLGCSSLTEIDISGFDTSKVTMMNGMFSKCTGLTKLDLSNFNTTNVTTMSYMFNDCTNLKELNVKSFNTSNVTDMRSMFKYCSSLETLDISNFDTRKAVRKINSEGVLDEGLELFMNASSLKSLLIGKNFVITEGSEKVFENCNALTAVIATSETPVENQFRGKLPTNTKLYVPNGCEDAYKEILSGDTDASKIKPILEVKGERDIKIAEGEDFIDEGYTVAGFEKSDSKYYECYGYNLDTTSDLDASAPGKYTIDYTLKRTYKTDGQASQEETAKETRNIEVLGVPNAPTNFKAIVVTNSGKATITWSGDGAEEGTTYKLEVLDNNGEWQLLSENATSPYEQTGVDETKAYEYRISAVSKDGIQSAYAYTISEVVLDETSIIINHDNIAPTITYIDVISEREYITKKDTIKIRFKAEDANYKYEESNILAKDITVKVGGIVNNDVIKSITKLNTESGEEYTLELTNITKIGELAIVIPQDKIIDKAGNKNAEAEFAIPITVANDVISDDAPSLALDENEITITNKQTTSITQIEKITYQYRISGDTEFETIPNGESGDKTSTNILKGALADTYYEIRTIVEDNAGNVKESQIATIKTDKMDNNLITITATPTTLTNGDVKVTITYNSKFIKEYSLDGATWMRVTSGDKKELTIKENTTIYARYTDGAKVTESKTYEVNNIDKQKPTIEKAYVTPEGKSNSKQIKVEGIVDLGVAGIKGYYINKESNLENATWQSFTGSEFSHKVTENGVYYVWVSDNAGNISEAKLVVVTGIVDGVSNIKYTGVIELEVGETRRLVVTYSGEAMSETYKSKDEKIVKVEANIKQIEGKSVGETEVIGTITDYDGTEHQIVIRVIVTPVTLQVKLTSDGNEYTGEWTNKDVKAELTTNGVKPSGYKEKDGENESLKDPKNIDINNITGKATITYDEDFSGEKYYVGNNSDGNQITNVAGGYLIKLDKTAPTIGVARKVVGTNSIAVQIVGADDALSGIKEYEIMIYKDDTCLATYKGESGEVTFANLKSSTAYQIKYKITDNAGNTTDLIDGGTEITGVIKKMVTYDYLTNGGTKLTLGSTEVVEAGKLFNLETIAGQFVDLTLESQKAGYIFKGWAKTPSGEVLTSLVMPEEDITLYAIFKDESAPVVTDKAYETVDGKLELILKVEDTGSGIEDYAVTTDEGTPNEWVTKTPEADGKVRLEVPGTNRYYVWVKDKEGNITRYEQIAIKDIFAPTGKVEVKENIVNNLPYAKSNEVKLYIEAEDNESVAQDIKVAIYNEAEYKNLKKYSDINFAYTYKDGGLNLTWQTTAGDGLKRIYVILKDKAGNISTTIKQLP